MNYTNSAILDCKPGPLPIVIGDGYLAAIPMGGSQTQMCVIHNGVPVNFPHHVALSGSMNSSTRNNQLPKNLFVQPGKQKNILLFS